MSVEREGYRLSPRQRWIWRLSAAGSYAVQGTLQLAGRCEASRLRDALDRVAARHDILRTAFVRPEGVKLPLQVLGDARPEWRELDLSELAPELQDERLAALATEERRPFDTASGSPVRASLVRLAPERHILVLTLAALCGDGRSLRNFVREIGDVHAGRPPAEDPVQYLQYSEWLHSVREDEEQTPRGRDRWLFQGLAEPTFPPLAGQTSAPATAFSPLVRELAIASAVAADLASLAGRLDVEIEEILHAAWRILAWRITGASPVTIGSTFHGRKHESLLDAQGPFAALAPVSCEIGDGDTLATVVGRMRQALADAEEWLEHYSPEDYLSPDGAPGLFPLGFAWEEWPSLRLPDGLEISLRSRSGAGDRSRLALFGLSRDGRLSAEIQGDASCLPASEIDRWAESFGALLASLARNPESLLGDLDLLTAAERQTLLADFNRTETSIPDSLTAHRLFAEQARRTPGATAVEHEGRTLTYADLDTRANLLARYLQRSGVGPDTPVGLFLGRTPELVVGMLGILKAGGAYLPLERSYPRERLELLLSDTGAALVLSESALAPALPAGARVLCLDSDWPEIAAAADGAEPADPASPESLAYILYTSGSTGRPKGVLVPHRGLVGYLLWSQEAYAIGAGQGAPVHSPLGFDLTVTSLWGPLVSGGKVLLLPEDEGAEALARALRPGADFSLVKITPSHLDALALTAPAAGTATRALVVGGEALLGETLAAWRAANPALRIFNEYGPTETVVGCSVHEVPPGAPAAGPVPIGRPIANTSIYLLNGSLRPVHEGAPGEIHIGGQGVARGYLGQPAATAERFIPDPFSTEPGGRLYRTGDLARHLAGGELQFLGRTDGQVKIRGYRIELGEIEATLARHPAVGGAVVLAREDVAGDRRLVAYVTGQGTAAPPNTDELRRFLVQSLPEALVPSAFVALDNFPLTSNGKVDRSALPVPSTSRPDLDQPYLAPRTPVEQTLAEIWAEVLGVERVGIRDNYFSLGGDSMRSVRVVALAQERDLKIELQDLFRFRTIEELASRIAVPGAAAPPLVQGSATTADDELDRLLDEIESLSDEDAHHQLAERLGTAAEGETR